MVYMFSTRKGYFSIILGAIRRESFRLTEMNRLSLKDADLHVLLYVFLYLQRVTSKMTLRSFRGLEGIRYHLKLLHARLYRPRVNGSRVT